MTLAASFAENYLGIDDAIVGDFQQGDSRSGEVEIRSSGSNSIVTTVLARQLGPDHEWFVIASVSAPIVLDQPEILDEIANPVVISGEATSASDAELVVELRVHGQSEPLAIDSVALTGGSPVPFRLELAWVSDAGWAQVLVSIRTEDSERLLSAGVISVRLA